MVSQAHVRFVGYVGAACNWLIPCAAIANQWKPVEQLNPRMAAALWAYSIVFTRWSVAISPPNFPLFVCHATNQVAQAATIARCGYHHYYGGGDEKTKMME
eukprot:PhM_4_TR10173/c0_g1_i1/m.4215/K22138/MPC1; mitochondrial pyruvate carrier 1